MVFKSIFNFFTTNFKMNGILVTGGAGFIGSHTCLKLLERNYKVFVLDSFENSSIKSMENVSQLCKKCGLKSNQDLNIYKGDIRDSSLLKKIFDDSILLNSKIIAVMHFAGLKSIPNSIIKPLSYWDVNVNGSINLLKTMQLYDCNTLVFSSSASIYSNNNKLPFNEKSKIEPINPYSITKYTVEQLLNNVFKSDTNKWRIACLRYFNPIGAHESGMIGESPKGHPDNFFPNLVNVALGLQNELKIFGNNWPTIDGTSVRDFLHVMDLAEGHLKTLDYLLNRKSQILTLNIGTGKGTSLLCLLKEFQEVNKIKLYFSYSSRREGDYPISIADNSLSMEILNWRPQKTIKEMCKDGFYWRKKHPFGYR